jgi:hypothetical protein
MLGLWDQRHRVYKDYSLELKAWEFLGLASCHSLEVLADVILQRLQLDLK